VVNIDLSNRKEIFLLLVILVVSLSLRLGVFLAIYSVDPSRILDDDSPTYYNPARALFRTGHFANSPETPELPEVVRTPGYPAFIAGTWLIFGERYFPVIMIQILISVGTIMMTYVIARAVWNPVAGLISSLLLSLDCASFNYSQKLLTETLFTFILIVAVFAGVSLALGKERKRKWAIFFGVALALATLVRPISYYLIFPILMVFLVSGIVTGRKWKEILLVFLLIALPWVVLVGGWQIRNFIATGSYEFSPTIGRKLLFSRGSGIIAQRDGITVQEARQKIDASLPDTEGWSRAELRDFYVKEGLSLIRQHPLLFIKTQMRGMAHVIFRPGEVEFLEYLTGKELITYSPVGDLLRLPFREYTRKWVVDNPFLFLPFLYEMAYFVIIYTGVIYSAWRIVSAERKSLVVHAFIWVVMLYFLIVSAGPEATERFRVPVVPLLALYAGNGLSLLLVALARGRPVNPAHTYRI